MTNEPFNHRVIGLAMETHRALGPGLDEDFYHQDFVGRLSASGIEHLSKPRRDLIYRGIVADTFEADVVFEGKLLLELKALRAAIDKEHFTQILIYQKFWRIRTALILDFGKPSLLPKRVLYSSKTGSFGKREVPSFVTDKKQALRLIQIADDCLRDIGLGYRESTWIGLMKAALQSEQVAVAENPAATTPGLGVAGLKCLVIEGKTAVMVTALGREVSAIDRANLQTSLRWLGLPWGICFHFGKDVADLKFVSRPGHGASALIPTDSENPRMKIR